MNEYLRRREIGKQLRRGDVFARSQGSDLAQIPIAHQQENPAETTGFFLVASMMKPPRQLYRSQ